MDLGSTEVNLMNAGVGYLPTSCCLEILEAPETT